MILANFCHCISNCNCVENDVLNHWIFEVIPHQKQTNTIWKISEITVTTKQHIEALS